ncbi:hypothetical protein N4T77_03055 [Clostridium sp. CX1]|uniref:EamA domain-containing protein n=1 Tax=Clostridium tanneri TaxID=3037988 RepID=A0ABU4JUZ4_9CLOT|nr:MULTISPECIES: hypothetical protein [unclassified Clostridium]MCT8975571.1 hypothetical protein [Clostridium sp. CX1]MDW8801971.1 hypothetical protein [Clostridium sp. A1-XYC3]
MNLYYISVLLVIASNVFYHIFQKSVPEAANPLISLIATYGIALILTLISFCIYPSDVGFIQSFKRLNWASYALGITIVGLELGFLLAYRAGWNISLVALFTNICVTVLLIPIGLLLYKEHISLINFVGILLSIAGVICIYQK